MSGPVPWTIVCYTADDSAAAVTASRLMSWMADQPSVELHGVLWATGHNGTAPYQYGRLANVAAARERAVPTALRRVGLSRLGGGLEGRSVRRAVRDVPTDGVLYLSSTRASSVLRFLPPGRRRVVTHLHAADRENDGFLPPDRVARLVDATDVWLAVDEATRDWAVESWGIDPGRVVIVPEPVESPRGIRAARVSDPHHLRLGIRGAAWFRTDHTARVVQRLLRRRPDLRLDLVWGEVIGAREHLDPMLHDLDHFGVGERLHLPRSAAEVEASLDDIDALVLTTPDDDWPWPMNHALERGVPIVCFDTHRLRDTVTAGAGLSVPYLDISAMADAILALHGDPVEEEASRTTTDAAVPDIVRHRRELRRRDVTRVGARLLELGHRES